MSNRAEERIEIEVQDWDRVANSFTTGEGLDPKYDRLIKDFALIPLLVLKQDGETLAEIPNARLIASESRYERPRVQTAIEDPSFQFTIYRYVQSDR